MFSGKTEEVQRQIRRALRGGKAVTLFVPKKDTRNEGVVVSHAGRESEVLPIAIDVTSRIFQHRPRMGLIVLDEAQFFDIDAPTVVQDLAREGFDVLVAGLDKTSERKPFPGPMPALMAVAHVVTKLSAICRLCGREAFDSHRLDPKDQATVCIGGEEAYEALCPICFDNVSALERLRAE
jgi:thymidine kinase